MKTINEVFDEIEQNNIAIENVRFKNKKASIMSYKDNAIMCIDYSKFNDTKEEKIAVAEENEHYNVGTFYKFNSPLQLIDKLEYKTRKRTYNKLIPFSELKKMLQKGYKLDELSDYFGVPEKDVFMAYFLYTNIENFSTT